MPPQGDSLGDCGDDRASPLQPKALGLAARDVLQGEIFANEALSAAAGSAGPSRWEPVFSDDTVRKHPGTQSSGSGAAGSGAAPPVSVLL